MDEPGLAGRYAARNDIRSISPMQLKRTELLQQMAIFGGIRNETLEFILALAPIVKVPKDEYFFKEGDAAESMFILESGRAVVLKGFEGKQHRVRELRPGGCFGEMSIMDFSPRSASVLAIENCTALEISTTCLHRLYERDLEQFTMIEMNMGREVSRRLREMNASRSMQSSRSDETQ